MIGKPPVEGNRRGSAVTANTQLANSMDIIDAPNDRGPTAGSNASIARALTGKFGR